MASSVSARKMKFCGDTPMHFAITFRFTKTFVKPRWYRPALAMDTLGLRNVLLLTRGPMDTRFNKNPIGGFSNITSAVLQKTIRRRLAAAPENNGRKTLAIQPMQISPKTRDLGHPDSEIQKCPPS